MGQAHQGYDTLLTHAIKGINKDARPRRQRKALRRQGEGRGGLHGRGEEGNRRSRAGRPDRHGQEVTAAAG